MDDATQRTAVQPPVLGPLPATGVVPDRGPAESASPRTPWGIEVGLGPRFAWVPDDRFDLFADSGYWPAFAARVGVSVWETGALDVAVSGAYHYGATDGAVRQSPTELVLHRVLLGGQARYHLLSWLAPYGRLLAGFSHLKSELDSGRDAEVLTLSKFNFSAVASAGVQARIIGSKRAGFFLHLYVDGGGVFTPKTELSHEMGSEAPPRSQPVEVGTLSLTGPQLETGVLARF